MQFKRPVLPLYEEVSVQFQGSSKRKSASAVNDDREGIKSTDILVHVNISHAYQVKQLFTSG